jgi:diadenosine tetraphosphate (Ap4A) HIT family hydrolase
MIKNHVLVASNRHIASFFDLEAFERNTCILLIDEVRHKNREKDRTVTGSNVGFNDEIDAG